MNKRLKIALIIAAVVVVVIIILAIIQQVFATRLVVNITRPMNITVNSQNGDTEFTETNTDHFSEIVPAGDYNINIEDPNDGTALRASAAVQDKTVTKSYDPPKPSSYYKALNAPVANPHKYEDSLFSLNPFTGVLQSIGSDGFPNPLPLSIEGADIQDVAWISRTKAVVTLNDNLPYIYDNGNLTPIDVGEALEQSFTPSIALAQSSSGEIALVINQLLYLFDTSSNQLKELVDLPFDPDSIDYKGNKIVATRGLVTVHDQPTGQGEPEKAKQANAIVDVKNKSQKSILPDSTQTIKFASLSPDGTKLFYTTADQAGVFDTDSGETIQETAPINGQTAAWRNDNQLVLAHEDGAWEYDFNKNYYYRIANIPDVVTTIFFINEELFYTTFPNDADAAVYRIGENKLATQLEDSLPVVEDGFQISYSLMGSEPTLLIETFASLNAPNRRAIYEDMTRELRKEAQEFLKRMNIKAENFRIIYTPNDVPN